MRTINLLPVLFIYLLGIATAGEKPPIYLTGNGTVDFFSGPRQLQSEQPIASYGDGSQAVFTPAGSEKSLWTAGLLSAAVPGAGEFYTKSYVKAGAFLATEVTAWIVALTYNNKGDRQTDAFEAFANAHWSPVRYAEFTINNVGVLTNNSVNAANYNVFPNGTGSGTTAPFRAVRWSALNALEDAVRSYPNNGYTHLLPAYGSQQYYELIGKYPQFSRGWDDSTPNSLIVTPGDLPIQSTSQRFFIYASMRAQANDYYDIAGTFVSVAVINHLVSAIDAIWSATRFNSNLHADFKMRVEPTQFGVAPHAEANFRYDF